MNRKSVLVAYLLWLFFGIWGIHKFYLGRTGMGGSLHLHSRSFRLWLDAGPLHSLASGSQGQSRRLHRSAAHAANNHHQQRQQRLALSKPAFSAGFFVCAYILLKRFFYYNIGRY
jgi:hypothetical protein